MNKPIIILGSGHVGKMAMEVFESNSLLIYGFLDEDNKQKGASIQEYTVLGTTDDEQYISIIGKDCDSFIATDDIALHKSLVKLLKAKRTVVPVNAIHSRSSIAGSAILGHGILVDMGAGIGAEAELFNYCLIHGGVYIQHQVKVGSYTQIGAGSVIGYGAIIEDEVFIGSGAVIVPGVIIGKGARIGAGSVVVKDVEKGKTVFGNPAQIIE